MGSSPGWVSVTGRADGTDPHLLPTGLLLAPHPSALQAPVPVAPVSQLRGRGLGPGVPRPALSAGAVPVSLRSAFVSVKCGLQKGLCLGCS